MSKGSFRNRVFYKSSKSMSEIPDDAVDLIVTSPPYFNVKDYSKDGHQSRQHSPQDGEDIGGLDDYSQYLKELDAVWKECERVLKPNGKLAVINEGRLVLTVTVLSPPLAGGIRGGVVRTVIEKHPPCIPPQAGGVSSIR